MSTERIRQAAFEAFRLETGHSAEDIDPDRDLRQQVHLDSMQFVAFLARLEVLLGVELPIESMTVSTLNEFLAVVGRQADETKSS